MEARRKIERALAFTGHCNPGYREAYELLCEDARKVLLRFLCNRGVQPEDIEDIIQTILVRVTKNWDRLHFDSLSQWYAYIYRAARNGLAELPSASTPLQTFEPPDPAPGPEEIFLRQALSDGLARLADEVWLGKPPADGSLKLLAARYIYSDGVDPAEVLDLLGPRSKSTTLSDIQDLDRWLSDVWTLRKTAFDTLYYSNEKLTAHILRRPICDCSDLDTIWSQARQNPPEAPTVEDWCARDVIIIMHRYRYGRPMVQTLRRLETTVDDEQVRSLTARCYASFPFEKEMDKLWLRMEGNAVREQALSANALWKRLTLQYHAIDALPHDDILDRVSPAASVAGYQLNNINTWVAGRLQKELIKHRGDAVTDD